MKHNAHPSLTSETHLELYLLYVSFTPRRQYSGKESFWAQLVMTYFTSWGFLVNQNMDHEMYQNSYAFYLANIWNEAQEREREREA